MGDMSRPVSGSQPDPELPGIQMAGSSILGLSRASKLAGPAGTDARKAEGTVSRAADEAVFIELRRKVQDGEVLSTSIERLLWKMKFGGRLTVVVQNGRVVKSGYEEGYFRRKNDFGALLFDGS